MTRTSPNPYPVLIHSKKTFKTYLVKYPGKFNVGKVSVKHLLSSTELVSCFVCGKLFIRRIKRKTLRRSAFKRAYAITCNTKCSQLLVYYRTKIKDPLKVRGKLWELQKN